jgi:hypothetical protein
VVTIWTNGFKREGAYLAASKKELQNPGKVVSLISPFSSLLVPGFWLVVLRGCFVGMSPWCFFL